MKLFGFNKRRKIKIDDLAVVYASTLFDVIDKGFPEIIEFVNDNRKFEESPNLQREDVIWFIMIIFAANNYRLIEFFDDSTVDKFHLSSLNELIKYIDMEEELVREMFMDYEKFFKEQLIEDASVEKAMAKSIFVKYNLNDFQGDLLKNQNEPNPVFLQELTDLLGLFTWNWSDYLIKFKVID
jgi:hypothetical protein